MIPVAMTIAGSDPSGGAGIQADLKTFHQRGVYGTAVLTLITVQNTCKVDRVHVLPPDLVRAQLEAVLEDIPPGAAKSGALGNGEVIRILAEAAPHFRFPLVVDPVMISKHGEPLMAEEARSQLASTLIPLAHLVTPNLMEASVLSGLEVDRPSAMEEAARRIARLGVPAVLIKGGHLPGVALDLLLWQGNLYRFESEHIRTVHTHGTGCTFSAAVTAELAKGQDMPAAVAAAKRFITRAIATAPGLGSGYGPVNHHAETTDA